MSGGKLLRSTMTMHVFSNSKPCGERDGIIFVNESPARFISQLARAFLNADLVDRLTLESFHLLLEGIPLFPSDFSQREFTLLENKTYCKGLLALTYERSRTRTKGKL